ncbi:MAG: sulfide-quinone oxidoreductase [Sulfobacillus acidophilus]|uniref:Sulfide-quinone oxidoreductase n=1 Tax=Sulfobacillus acidophilus TaxID=53633 RepID=A0A2T2WDM5_9FIRM|nr:MAG: sulfide-quinone oxidoreductase [Sulfobacillus acidophilus]
MATIVIAGSGFAGLTTAIQLKRRLKRLGSHHRIIVVAHDSRFLYRPALPQVAFGNKQPEDISFPLAPIYRRLGIEFYVHTVLDIDPVARRVVTTGDSLSYDKLVVALGEHLAFDEIPGLAEFGHSVCTAQGALALRQALAQYQGGPVVVGWAQYVQTGGPAFEVALEVSHLLKRRQLTGPIQFVDPLPRLWAPAGAKASQFLEEVFAENNITRFGSVNIQRVYADRVLLSDGRELPSVLSIITPPFRGVAAQTALAQGHARNWLETGRNMRSLTYPDVYVAGSAVAFDGPKQGHTAMLQAAVVAANLTRDLAASENAEQLYDHEMSCVLDLGSGQGLFVRRTLWNSSREEVLVGRKWPVLKAALGYTFVKTPVFKRWGLTMPSPKVRTRSSVQ